MSAAFRRLLPCADEELATPEDDDAPPCPEDVVLLPDEDDAPPCPDDVALLADDVACLPPVPAPPVVPDEVVPESTTGGDGRDYHHAPDQARSSTHPLKLRHRAYPRHGHV